VPGRLRTAADGHRRLLSRASGSDDRSAASEDRIFKRDFRTPSFLNHGAANTALDVNDQIDILDGTDADGNHLAIAQAARRGASPTRQACSTDPTATVAGAMAVAQKIAARAPVAVAATREMINCARDESVAAPFSCMNALQPALRTPDTVRRLAKDWRRCKRPCSGPRRPGSVPDHRRASGVPLVDRRGHAGLGLRPMAMPASFEKRSWMPPSTRDMPTSWMKSSTAEQRVDQRGVHAAPRLRTAWRCRRRPGPASGPRSAPRRSRWAAASSPRTARSRSVRPCAECSPGGPAP